MQQRIRTLIMRASGVIALCSLLSACGGGSFNQQNNVGPTAILNGGTLSTASSHWVGQNCSIQVELTADGGFWFWGRNISGITVSGAGTWSVDPTDSASALMPNEMSGLEGTFWATQLKSIQGSTASRSFTADVIVALNAGGGNQQLNSCVFGLQSGAMQ